MSYSLCVPRAIGCWLLVLILATPALGGGLLPDRANKVLIEGQFSNPQQGFVLVFSAKPLSDERNRPLTSLPEEELKSFVNSRDQVLIKVYGKPQTKPGEFEFCFGPGDDKDRPWNNGREFAWENWAELSPDIWDNLCVVAPLTRGAKNGFAAITNVAIIKGDKLLYDSRKQESYPNKLRVAARFARFNAAPKQSNLPLLNLSSLMTKFRREFYELGDNPYLHSAYADLGQTEKRKYASRGNNWCSEFASWVYRDNGLMTPDPNRADVHFRSMREFFAEHGQVYPMREVASWSDKEKLARIKPGSFVSIRIGDTTHSLVFTTWVRNRQGPITSYTAISGNNKGMVWPHAPQKLPTAESFRQMPAAEQAEIDAKVYFAVPPDGKQGLAGR